MRSKIKKFFIILSLCLIGLTGCTRFVANPDACYNDKVKQLLTSNCATADCHNPKDHEAGYDFTYYEGVMQAVKAKYADLSELYRVLDSKGEEHMPPNYSLTKDEKAMIKNWINNGAENNTCYVPVCDTSQFTYSTVSAILKSNCVGCHNKNNISGAVILDSYTSVVSAVNNNNLIGTIKHESGSPMPKYSAKLSECTIRTIEKWVEVGMPNN